MNGIAKKILDFLKKIAYFKLQYGYTAYFWLLRFFKIQLKKWKKCGSQKKMEKVCSGLGSEIYALHKQGRTDWSAMPSVQQQLRHVEETESALFNVDEAIEEIENEYRNRKEEIKEKYAAKRSQIGGSGTEDA